MYSLLICDDENYILDMLSNYIKWEEIGVKVKDTAINGQIGFNKFKMDTFDIILADIKMPIMSGLDMAKRIREFDKRVQIVFLTSLSEFEAAQTAIQLNASGYILKPFSDQELLDTVKAAVDRLNGNSNTAEQIKQGEIKETDFITDNVNKYINEHIWKKLSLKEISEHFGYSTNYLGQIYKKNSGIYVSDYIIKVKMEKAAELLKLPQNQVGTVANTLGYSDISYFIKQFREYYGVTPKVFRERCRG